MTFASFFRERLNEEQGYRAILRVCLPLVAGMASSTVMQFTDRLFLSRYSVDAIAASMPASIASMTIVMTLMGVCGYTSVLIAQYVGSGAPQRVGSALWQGIWFALGASILLCLTWEPAKAMFALAGHDPEIQDLEVTYFRVLTTGAGFSLLGATLAGFFSGRGETRPVMVANIAAMIINVPLDYLLIFGGLGIPSMGILGAGLATVIGWIVGVIIMVAVIFRPQNNRLYHLRQGIRFEWQMFRRLLRFGLPSGVNFFMEMVAVAWFAFEVGAFGKEALAASNIAFSMNSLTFVPMLGLNIGLSSLVGQAMGQGQVAQAERVTFNTLHLAFLYMLPLAALIALFAGPLMDLFKPNDLAPETYAEVRELGVVLLYFIAVYSLVDAMNIVFFGALKGAGDTLGIMYMLLGGLIFLLILPILALKRLGLASPVSYWMAFTVYVMLLAVLALLRFYNRGWHKIRVVETAAGSEQPEAK
ncbi:MATE family efflux transporter [Desulfovibrio sp. OttesenSCG-928-F20]|nr:MATE family efflux transporter [Desulfovibrio sp. OttesenSCG-928-F20]